MQKSSKEVQSVTYDFTAYVDKLCLDYDGCVTLANDFSSHVPAIFNRSGLPGIYLSLCQRNLICLTDTLNKILIERKSCLIPNATKQIIADITIAMALENKSVFYVNPRMHIERIKQDRHFKVKLAKYLSEYEYVVIDRLDKSPASSLTNAFIESLEIARKKNPTISYLFACDDSLKIEHLLSGYNVVSELIVVGEKPSNEVEKLVEVKTAEVVDWNGFLEKRFYAQDQKFFTPKMLVRYGVFTVMNSQKRAEHEIEYIDKETGKKIKKDKLYNFPPQNIGSVRVELSGPILDYDDLHVALILFREFLRNQNEEGTIDLSLSELARKKYNTEKIGYKQKELVRRCLERLSKLNIGIVDRSEKSANSDIFRGHLINSYRRIGTGSNSKYRITLSKEMAPQALMFFNIPEGFLKLSHYQQAIMLYVDSFGKNSPYPMEFERWRQIMGLPAHEIVQKDLTEKQRKQRARDEKSRFLKAGKDLVEKGYLKRCDIDKKNVVYIS